MEANLIVIGTFVAVAAYLYMKMEEPSQYEHENPVTIFNIPYHVPDRILQDKARLQREELMNGPKKGEAAFKLMRQHDNRGMFVGSRI